MFSFTTSQGEVYWDHPAEALTVIQQAYEDRAVRIAQKNNLLDAAAEAAVRSVAQEKFAELMQQLPPVLEAQRTSIPSRISADGRPAFVEQCNAVLRVVQEWNQTHIPDIYISVGDAEKISPSQFDKSDMERLRDRLTLVRRLYPKLSEEGQRVLLFPSFLLAVLGFKPGYIAFDGDPTLDGFYSELKSKNLFAKFPLTHFSNQVACDATSFWTLAKPMRHEFVRLKLLTKTDIFIDLTDRERLTDTLAALVTLSGMDDWSIVTSQHNLLGGILAGIPANLVEPIIPLSRYQMATMTRVVYSAYSDLKLSGGIDRAPVPDAGVDFMRRQTAILTYAYASLQSLQGFSSIAQEWNLPMNEIGAYQPEKTVVGQQIGTLPKIEPFSNKYTIVPVADPSKLVLRIQSMDKTQGKDLGKLNRFQEFFLAQLRAGNTGHSLRHIKPFNGTEELELEQEVNKYMAGQKSNFVTIFKFLNKDEKRAIIAEVVRIFGTSAAAIQEASQSKILSREDQIFLHSFFSMAVFCIAVLKSTPFHQTLSSYLLKQSQPWKNEKLKKDFVPVGISVFMAPYVNPHSVSESPLWEEGNRFVGLFPPSEEIEIYSGHDLPEGVTPYFKDHTLVLPGFLGLIKLHQGITSYKSANIAHLQDKNIPADVSEGGAFVSGWGKTPFVFYSDSCDPAEIEGAKQAIGEKIPKLVDINFYRLPSGWTTYHQDGDEKFYGNNHLDTVMGFIPAELTTDGKAKLLVDPIYFNEVKDHPEFQRFKADQANQVDIVLVNENERQYNPANLVLFFTKDVLHVAINFAPETIQALNLIPERLHTFKDKKDAIWLVANGGSGIGCLAGLDVRASAINSALSYLTKNKITQLLWMAGEMSAIVLAKLFWSQNASNGVIALVLVLHPLFWMIANLMGRSPPSIVQGMLFRHIPMFGFYALANNFNHFDWAQAMFSSYGTLLLIIPVLLHLATDLYLLYPQSTLNETHFLMALKEDSLDQDMATRYSRLKMGDYSQVQYFGDLLIAAIKKNVNQELSPEEGWVICTPGLRDGQGKTIASIELGNYIGKKLNLPMSFVNYTTNYTGPYARSKKRSERLSMWRQSQLQSTLSVRGKKIIFVDDSVVSGALAKNHIDYFKANGAASVDSFFVARIKNNSDFSFEDRVNRAALQTDKIHVLQTLLNDPRNKMTARLLQYISNLTNDEFGAFYPNLNPDAVSRLLEALSVYSEVMVPSWMLTRLKEKENNFQQQSRQTAVSIVKEIAQLLPEEQKQFITAHHEARTKADGSPVTDVDVRMQVMIMRDILSHFPDHYILGEESADVRREAPDLYTQNERNRNSPYVWTLDPIDGTKGFEKNTNRYGTSLALYHRGEPVVGVVWSAALVDKKNPTKLGLLVASRDRDGVYWDNDRIDVANLPRTTRPVVILSDRKSAFQSDLRKQLSALFPSMDVIDSGGSSVVVAGEVLNGQVHTYSVVGRERGSYMWDVSAIAYILTKAGMPYEVKVGENYIPGLTHIKELLTSEIPESRTAQIFDLFGASDEFSLSSLIIKGLVKDGVYTTRLHDAFANAKENPQAKISLGDLVPGFGGAMRVAEIKAGGPTLPIHQHPHAEHYFILPGAEGLLQVGDKAVMVKAGDWVRIPPNTPHTIQRMDVGNESLRLVFAFPGQYRRTLRSDVNKLTEANANPMDIQVMNLLSPGAPVRDLTENKMDIQFVHGNHSEPIRVPKGGSLQLFIARGSARVQLSNGKTIQLKAGADSVELDAALLMGDLSMTVEGTPDSMLFVTRTVGNLSDNFSMDHWDKNFREWYFSDMDPMDRYLLSEILKGDEDQLRSLLMKYSNRVAIGYREFFNPNEGRTVYLSLATPFGTISELRIKGARPRRNSQEIVEAYAGQSRISKGIYGNSDGDLVLGDTPSGPFGAMSENQIHNEQMNGGQGDPVLVRGTWQSMSFLGKPTGAIVYGMSQSDHRLRLQTTLSSDSDDSVQAFLKVMDVEVKTAHIKSLSTHQGQLLYRDFGAQLKNLHDTGRVHGELHLDNIGAQFGLDGQPNKTTLRDFSSSHVISDSLLPISKRAEIAHRLADLLVVISVLVKNRTYYDAVDVGDVQTYSVNNIDLYLTAFFRGYLGESVSDEQIKAFVEKLNSDQYLELVGGLFKGTIQKIELTDQTPVLGLLWQALDRVLEVRAPSDSIPNSAISYLNKNKKAHLIWMAGEMAAIVLAKFFWSQPASNGVLALVLVLHPLFWMIAKLMGRSPPSILDGMWQRHLPMFALYAVVYNFGSFDFAAASLLSSCQLFLPVFIHLLWDLDIIFQVRKNLNHLFRWWDHASPVIWMEWNGGFFKRIPVGIQLDGLRVNMDGPTDFKNAEGSSAAAQKFNEIIRLRKVDTEWAMAANQLAQELSPDDWRSINPRIERDYLPKIVYRVNILRRCKDLVRDLEASDDPAIRSQLNSINLSITNDLEEAYSSVTAYVTEDKEKFALLDKALGVVVQNVDKNPALKIRGFESYLRLTIAEILLKSWQPLHALDYLTEDGKGYELTSRINHTSEVLLAYKSALSEAGILAEVYTGEVTFKNESEIAFVRASENYSKYQFFVLRSLLDAGFYYQLINFPSTPVELKASALTRVGRASEAWNLLESKPRPTSSHWVAAKIETLLALDRMAEANTFIDGLSEKIKDHPRVASTIADFYSDRGETKIGVQLLSESDDHGDIRIADHFFEFGLPRVALARLLLRDKKYHLLKSVLNGVFRFLDHNVMARTVLMRIVYRVDPVRAFSQVASRVGERWFLNHIYEKNIAVIYVFIDVLFLTRDKDACAVAAKKYLAAYPTDVYLQAFDRFMQARQDFDAGRYVEAIEKYKSLPARNPFECMSLQKITYRIAECEQKLNISGQGSPAASMLYHGALLLGPSSLGEISQRYVNYLKSIGKVGAILEAVAFVYFSYTMEVLSPLRIFIAAFFFMDTVLALMVHAKTKRAGIFKPTQQMGLAVLYMVIPFVVNVIVPDRFDHGPLLIMSLLTAVGLSHAFLDFKKINSEVIKADSSLEQKKSAAARVVVDVMVALKTKNAGTLFKSKSLHVGDRRDVERELDQKALANLPEWLQEHDFRQKVLSLWQEHFPGLPQDISSEAERNAFVRVACAMLLAQSDVTRSRENSVPVESFSDDATTSVHLDRKCTLVFMGEADNKMSNEARQVLLMSTLISFGRTSKNILVTEASTQALAQKSVNDLLQWNLIDPQQIQFTHDEGLLSANASNVVDRYSTHPLTQGSFLIVVPSRMRPANSSNFVKSFEDLFPLVYQKLDTLISSLRQMLINA